MEMKIINGGIGYSAHDGDLYELEAYLPDEEVYVFVHHCYNDWGYGVKDKPGDDGKILECYHDEAEIRGSEYEDALRLLGMMVRVMEMANR